MLKNGSIENGRVKSYSKEFNGSKKNIAMMNAVSAGGIENTALRNDVLRTARHKFSIDIDDMGVTNQKASGRCWMFAGLNLIRRKVAKDYNLEFFELSQNYLAFWDKFEKTNYFLETILDTLEEPVEGRMLSWILQNTIADGGQWDMFVNLINKYGVVPKDAMPETYHSSKTGSMNRLLSLKLREYALRLREQAQQNKDTKALRKVKEEMLGEMYRFFCIFFGEPPSVIDFECMDKDRKYISDLSLTPQEFYKKHADIGLGDYVSIINSPTRDKPFGRTYTVKYLGNVVGGRSVTYLNLEISEMKKLVVAQLKENRPVWFGCDVGKMIYGEKGILDEKTYDYELVLDMPFGLTKGERLDYKESFMTHAMVFTGVNLIDDVPTRWKVENSWGDEKANKGYYVMSDGWFDDHMYQVVVHKKYLSEKQKQALKKEPIVLEPWDPMGSLA